MRGIYILCFIGAITWSAVEMNGGSPSMSNSSRPAKAVTGNSTARESIAALAAASPTATIIGSGSVCEGDSLIAFLYLTGQSPWDLVISNSSGVYKTLTGITSTSLPVWLKPDQDDTFTVTEIVDGDGKSGSTFGASVVTMNYPTPVQILLDRTTYKSSELGVELHADHEPGIFSGPGVSQGYFYPSVAFTVGPSPYTVTYEYQNLYGCRSTDEIDIEVVEGTGSVYLISGNDTISRLCDRSGTFEIVGSNDDGIAGTFELRIANSSTVVPGHILDEDLNDNRALFDPTGLKGGYDILYTYVIDQVVLNASFYVIIDYIDTVRITTPFPELVCKSDTPYELTGNMDGADPLAVWSFTGTGVSGDMSSGFYFDPGDPAVKPGTIKITYRYTTESGCTASTTTTMTVGFVPDVLFEIDGGCIPEEGGTIEFINRTTGKYAVEMWTWNFGDISSGSDNTSHEENPSHFYLEAGRRKIILTATTFDGCESSFEIDTILTDAPRVNFGWISDCFIRGEDAVFVNKTVSEFADLDTLIWTIKTDKGLEMGRIGASPGDDTISVKFETLGTYLMDLYALNSLGCSDNLTREFAFTPTIQVASTGFKEDFNKSEGSWSIRSDDGQESWVWGVPDFKGFPQVYGDKAWYTDLPYQVDGYIENSWVQSTCYDFSKLKRPLMRVDIMKSFVPNATGAVLQYMDVVDDGWKTIGTLEDGIEWYNSNTLVNKPGGSSVGWGLSVFQPDMSWVSATHDLDMVAGKKRIKLRFAIATNGGQEIGNEGFAFDNVFLAERTRKSVLEHFTNSGDDASKIADDLVDSYFHENYWDVIDLQYHMGYPGIDPMNLNNPDPAKIRAGSLGVNQVPYAILDGGTVPVHRYDFSDASHSPGSDELKMLSLVLPKFLVGMATRWMYNRLEVDVAVTSVVGSYTNNLQLFVAVIESEVTMYTGYNQDTAFRNVVLDMLPDPRGKLLGNEWYMGKTEKRSFTWDFPDYIEDVIDLGVVVFVQDRETGKILQAATSHLNTQVGIRSPRTEMEPMAIYPNPANRFLYVNTGERVSNQGSLMIMDLSGKIVMQREVMPGYAIHRLDISTLPQGMYMVCWYESGILKGRNKLVRTR